MGEKGKGEEVKGKREQEISQTSKGESSHGEKETSTEL
jgi:hypothetical protein